MNLGELQTGLRHFAAERDWQPFHTPKNLATALMVAAAELAEIFQWMTPEASAAAHENAGSKAHIGAEVADVLLYCCKWPTTARSTWRTQCGTSWTATPRSTRRSM